MRFSYDKILLIGLLFSCSASDREKENGKNKPASDSLRSDKLTTSNYHPDTAFTCKGGSIQFAMNVFKLSESVVLDKMTPSQVSKNKIKSITREGLYHQKFDVNGHKIYEKYRSWSSGYNLKYQFDKNQRPVSVSYLDTNEQIIGTAKFKYDLENKLLQAGDLIFKYNPSGLLTSSEDANEIETYEYDSKNNIVCILFKTQTGKGKCGNGIDQWKGEYNDKGQLIKAQEFGLANTTTKYTYSQSGQLIKSEHFIGGDKLVATSEYLYTKGLLTLVKTFDENQRPKITTKYSYETY